MKRSVPRILATFCVVALALAAIVGCLRENYPSWLVANNRTSAAGGGGIFDGGPTFADNLIQARTFTDGKAVTTVTYRASDMARTQLGVDFNADHKIDPVIGYGEDQAVLQILLSRGDPGTVEYTSLTLDSKRDMENLLDVAVGDIDGDGALDVIAAATGAVWYFHHLTGLPTTSLTAWGNPDPTDALRERIDASYLLLSDSELEALIAQAIGPGVNLDDYIVTVKQLYPNVEIADFDNDGDNDVVASRSFTILLTPKPEVPVEPLRIVDGDVLIFVNPGFATTGHGWGSISIGQHERHVRLDRDGASGLLAADLDGDNDLDVISAARDDNNAQIAWFENPGPPLNTTRTWTQWRVGSLRDAFGIDVADLTGDGRLDVIATGAAQMQMLLFVQPESGPKRGYDWDTYPIVTFESYEPRDVKVFDLDLDGQLEIVLGGTEGALRYLEATADPTDEWEVSNILTFDPAGEVGLLGYGDLDGDGDLDLVTVLDANEQGDVTDRLMWIRNDLVP